MEQIRGGQKISTKVAKEAQKQVPRTRMRSKRPAPVSAEDPSATAPPAKKRKKAAKSKKAKDFKDDEAKLEDPNKPPYPHKKGLLARWGIANPKKKAAACCSAGHKAYSSAYRSALSAGKNKQEAQEAGRKASKAMKATSSTA